jgi:hypothetical protein
MKTYCSFNGSTTCRSALTELIWRAMARIGNKACHETDYSEDLKGRLSLTVRFSQRGWGEMWMATEATTGRRSRPKLPRRYVHRWQEHWDRPCEVPWGDSAREPAFFTARGIRYTDSRPDLVVIKRVVELSTLEATLEVSGAYSPSQAIKPAIGLLQLLNDLASSY